MAQKRYINTDFWKDNYIIDSNPSDKYIFLYLLTNGNTNIAGIYEISLRQMAFETGYDDDAIRKILAKFEKDNKLVYRGGWIILKNWEKHQMKNPSVEQGIERIKENLPDFVKELLKEMKNGQTSLLNSLEV